MNTSVPKRSEEIVNSTNARSIAKSKKSRAGKRSRRRNVIKNESQTSDSLASCMQSGAKVESPMLGTSGHIKQQAELRPFERNTPSVAMKQKSKLHSYWKPLKRLELTSMGTVPHMRLRRLHWIPSKKKKIKGALDTLLSEGGARRRRQDRAIASLLAACSVQEAWDCSLNIERLNAEQDVCDEEVQHCEKLLGHGPVVDSLPDGAKAYAASSLMLKLVEDLQVHVQKMCEATTMPMIVQEIFRACLCISKIEDFLHRQGQCDERTVERLKESIEHAESVMDASVVSLNGRLASIRVSNHQNLPSKTIKESVALHPRRGEQSADWKPITGVQKFPSCEHTFYPTENLVSTTNTDNERSTLTPNNTLSIIELADDSYLDPEWHWMSNPYIEQGYEVNQ